MSCLLTICIVNYNSSDFVLNTLYCLEKITKNSYKVIIRDNYSRIEDYKNLQKNVAKYSNVKLYRVENFNYTGSMAHGIAINDLINRIDTKYGVILDADCTFLIKNWDELLINEINENYPIIGTQAPQGYGSEKPGDFPLMFGILFYTEILKKINIDFRPKNPNEYQDTGYLLKEKFLEFNYNGKILTSKNTRDFKLGPFAKIICSEYYLNGVNDLIASHFGRGSSLGKPKYLKTGFKRYIYLFPIIGSYFVKRRGKKEKYRWINICKKIVDRINFSNA